VFLALLWERLRSGGLGGAMGGAVIALALTPWTPAGVPLTALLRAL
jgi:hypothetical protein